MAVKQIIYTSKESRELNVSDLIDIMSSSVRNNSTYDITGFLIYKDGMFRQLIEGSPHVINILYDIICKDPRHTVLTKNLERYVEERTMPLWAMGFCTSKDKTHFKELKKELFIFDPEVLDTLDNDHVINILKEFINS